MNRKTKNRGFSLFEVIIVVAMSAVFFAVAGPFSLNFYRTQLVEEARSNVIEALLRAKHNAALQKNDSNFGLTLSEVPNNYVLFEGSSYDLRNEAQDETFPIISDIVFSGLTDVIFSKLTGRPDTVGTTTLTYGNVSRGILIEESGTISKVDVADAALLPWYNLDWSYRVKITIDHNRVANTDQTNFPVLISRTNLKLKEVASGGHVGQADGGDILFTADDRETKLDHEIEKYDPATGELIAWVKIPLLATATDTEIYLYYGNATVADQADITGTWDGGGDGNFRLVEHFGEAPANNGLYYDSTVNNNDFTYKDPTGNGNSSASGKIGLTNDYPGSSNYLLDNQTDSLSLRPNRLTFSAWVNLNSAVDSCIFTRSPHTDYTLWINDGVGVNKYIFYVFGLAGTPTVTSETVTAGWHHIVVTYNGSALIMYDNGVLVSQTAASGNISYNVYNHNASIGSYYSANFVDGLIDELRISAVARSADWIATEYNNQNSPATFYTVSGEEAI